jgi:hypothetical protein
MASPSTRRGSGSGSPITAVLQVARDGRETARIEAPRTAAYENRPFRPTSVALASGSGEIWVADGYGASLVHRYSSQGDLLGSLDGDATGERFDCPHALAIDRRSVQPRVLVADRGRARIVAFDLAGRFLSTFGLGHLTSPSAFAIVADLLVVAELRGRLTLFNRRDDFVGHLASGEDAAAEEGWPNTMVDGLLARRADLQPGRLISPHSLAAAEDGTIYVSEWLIGGRLVRLRRIA